MQNRMLVLGGLDVAAVYLMRELVVDHIERRQI